MTPAQFIALWQNNPLSERAGAQGHFDDLCELLGVDKPRDPATWGDIEVVWCDGPEDSIVFLPNSAPAAARSITKATRKLNQLRENWLNPIEWADRISEIVAGYPDRIVAKPGHEAELKKRTLTNLYNARPAWLDNAHKALDAAVAAAYGWADYMPAMPDEEILRRLLALNLVRSSGQGV